MQEVYIVASVRSAVARKDGQLAHVRPDELLAEILDQLMERAVVEKSVVEDVIIGCVTQINEQAMNIARTAALMAGFPKEVPGVTIDRQCGSSQQAVHFGAQAIAAGDMDVVIAGGVESMTRSPMFANVGQTKHSPQLTKMYDIVHQGLSAEKIAKKWNLSRQMLDEFAFLSHERALNAIAEERFSDEIFPLEIRDQNDNDIVFATDEGPRADTSMDALANLKPVFQADGKVTAGNASQMSDGASAVLLMSGEKVKALGLKPQAKIIARTVVGSDPTLMLTGPIAATNQVLKRAQLTLDDIDRFEVNEAFASVPLAWLAETNADPSKLNVNGGAIALGHPLGATGTRLMTTLLHELERMDGKYGLVAICEGMGMANATIFERIE
ncbi:MAG TPA: thiolase family protein [Bacillota bacterium]|nr:thiolase family protein [Bacillota bacterium]